MSSQSPLRPQTYHKWTITIHIQLMSGDVIHFEASQMFGKAPVVHTNRSMQRRVLEYLTLDPEQHTVTFILDNENKREYTDDDVVHAVVN